MFASGCGILFISGVATCSTGAGAASGVTCAGTACVAAESAAGCCSCTACPSSPFFFFFPVTIKIIIAASIAITPVVINKPGTDVNHSKLKFILYRLPLLYSILMITKKICNCKSFYLLYIP